MLPPWYNSGGARNPAPINSVRPVIPGIAGALPGSGGRVVAPANRGMVRGAGGAPRTASTGMINTAPVNPWQMQATNTPIYNEGQAGADLSLLEKLAQETKNRPGPSLVSADQAQYTRSGDFGDAIGKAKDWSNTGGFSDQDLASLRARGTSPLRAVYSNANRNLQRQRSLQGGYAPGMLAATARMAREQGELMSEGMMKVNADISDRVQKGKEFGLGKYADMAGGENTLMSNFALQNSGNRQQANIHNAGATNNYNTQGTDSAFKLAQLRQQILDNNRSGRLQERVSTNAGNLGYEQLNQNGGIALMNAMMQQYAPNATLRRGRA